MLMREKAMTGLEVRKKQKILKTAKTEEWKQSEIL